MPELPEVETTRLGLGPLVGHRIVRVDIRNASLRQPVPDSLHEMSGQTLRGIERRSKYLILKFANGSAIVHLGMSGSLRVDIQENPTRKHDHILIDTDDGFSLRFHDPRRFGLFLWTANDPVDHPLFLKLGPEPLEDGFTSDHLFYVSRRRRCPVKAFLMDNTVVVGVGNIYAAESLFQCGIHPLRPSNSLSTIDCQNLHEKIRNILERAISRGGTTLRDFVNSQGNPGYFKQELAVYGREGEACRVCENTLQIVRIAGRSSVFCPICQPMPAEMLA